MTKIKRPTNKYQRTVEWRNKNRKKVNAWLRSWRARNPHKAFIYNIRRYTNFNEDKYNEFILKQNNRCAICKEVFNTTRNIHIDHDHTTGEVRGLLCLNCNVGIGRLKDNVELLKNAINYLEIYNGASPSQ